MGKFDLKSLLSEKSLAKEVHEGEVLNKPFKVEYISVHQLEPSPDNFYSVEHVQELKDSIELLGGVKQNLVVKKIDEDEYQVIAGHKRRLASLELVEEGKEEYEFLPCIVEEMDTIEERLLLIMTNSTARQLSDYEKSQQAQELKMLLVEYKKQEKLPGRIRDLVADILGTSASQIGKMEAISNNLIPEFQEEWKENEVNTSTVYEISSMSEEKQEEAYEKYKENGSITAIEVKEMKQEQDYQEPLKGQVGFCEEEVEGAYIEADEKLDETEETDVEAEEVLKGKEKINIEAVEHVKSLKQEQNTKEEKKCSYCKEQDHISIATHEGNYLIDIDSKAKTVQVMVRGYESDTVGFIFCPMCGQRL